MRAHQRKALHVAPEAFQGPPAPFFWGPDRWIAGDGAWEASAPALSAWGGPLGLLAETSQLKRFRRAVSSAWLEAGLDVKLVPLGDGVDCCAAALDSVLGRARAEGWVGLVGLGGGRVLDLAKWAAWTLKLPVATAPTSVATCACATAVVVRNEENGGFSEVIDLAGPPQLCVVEMNVLRAAPARLLAAGLADTLAKWLEWEALGSAPGPFGDAAGRLFARTGADVCRALGAEALQFPASAAFASVVEACLLWSAAASCAGRAPAAAAHSLANALSQQVPGRALLHGEAVALGLLWQESLLARAGSATMGLDALGSLFKAWGLPTRLPSGLDLGQVSRDAWAEGESSHGLGLEDEAGRGFDALLGGS